ncbi:hypothetical protein WFZ85_09215 [Flavobacterium sp. j3]|uniref:Uncharacterized protein n=1 Tax=Flavobacterium aureirubrum TaxID=3133147 RepID=A0ABU9N867_9FLAO
METTPPKNESTTKPVKTSNVPLADIDFGNVVEKASDKWILTPWLTLLWMTAEEFKVKSDNYKTTLAVRIQTGSNRPQITKSLVNINKEIDEKLSYVKGYIAEKYGKDNAVSYYASFGIEYSNKTYRFPFDQNNRSKALALMVDAISANGLNDKMYGKDYWLEIQTKYDDLLAAASSNDGTVSNKVGNKNALKKELKVVLNSLIFSIKANYPETYKQELRAWGFQKEKY